MGGVEATLRGRSRERLIVVALGLLNRSPCYFQFHLPIQPKEAGIMFCLGSIVAPTYGSPERQPVQWTQFPLCWLSRRA